jgi:hypothetical protein
MTARPEQDSSTHHARATYGSHPESSYNKLNIINAKKRTTTHPCNQYSIIVQKPCGISCRKHVEKIHKIALHFALTLVFVD